MTTILSDISTKDAFTILAPIFGAFLAAWLGAHLGYRKTRKERALDRIVIWHEESIQSLARYEEALEEIHKHGLNALIIKPKNNERQNNPDEERSIEHTSDLSGSGFFRPPENIWNQLGDIELRARSTLRLADLYANDEKTKVFCSSTLTSGISLVSEQWIDLSPSPRIQHTSLVGKIATTKNTRLLLQESLRTVLELDGLPARLLGNWYVQKLRLRRLNKLEKQLKLNA